MSGAGDCIKLFLTYVATVINTLKGFAKEAQAAWSSAHYGSLVGDGNRRLHMAVIG